MFQKHVKHILDDVENRQGEAKARKLHLEIEIKPVIERDKETGDCRVEEIRFDLKGKAKVPDYQTRSYPMKITSQGLFFNREIPEDLHQPSLIPEEADDK